MKLNPLKINSRFRCENTYKELNSLIKSTAELVEKGENGYNSSASLFEEHIDLLYSHLFEKTNLKNRLNDLKDSKRSINIKIFELLYKLQKFDENVLTDKLLELLSEELNKIEKKREIKYKIIFLLNIKEFRTTLRSDVEIEDLKIYNDILELFGMKRVKFQEFINTYEKSDDKELEKIKTFFSLFNSISGEIIEISAEGRDLEFVLNYVFSELEFLFGFLSFIRYSLRKGYRWSYNADYSIDNLDYISLFVLDDNGKVVTPQTNYRIRLDINDWKNSNLVDLNIQKYPDRFRDYYNFAKEDKSAKNKSKMWNNLKEFLCLYHNACSEKSMDDSFLSFWRVSEKIIKTIHGNMKDLELLRTIEKILKMFYKQPVEKFVEKRIKFLYSKRNKLVHEGNFRIISEEDRNLSKLIADCVLIFYIDNFPRLNNISEYKFLLQNFKKSNKEIKRYSELLKLISKARNN